MKKRNIIITITTLVISIVSIMASLSLTDISKALVWDWISITMIVISVVIIICFVLVTSLMARRWKISNIYISYTPTGKDVANRVAMSLEGENIQSSTTLSPGANMNYYVSKNIHKSNICFVIISGHISAMQREEIKEIISQKKNVITIVTPDCEQMPTRLRDIIPLQSNDSNFEEKIVEAVSQLK